MKTIIVRGWDGTEMLAPQDLSQARSNWPWLGIVDVEIMLWSGETDRSGIRIFDGDIVRIGHEPFGNEDDDGNEYTDYESTQISAVHFDQGVFSISGDFGDFSTTAIGWLDYDGEYEFEVIGNIYQNPELLQGGDHADI